MKKSIILVLIFIINFSCNKVGETIGEIPISNADITSIDEINLKKGDEIVFWSKFEINYDTLPKFYNYKYLISFDNQLIKFDSINPFYNGSHDLHSVSEVVFDTIKTYHDKDSIIKRTHWTFEKEHFSFKIPKDGKYFFDFKANKKDNISPFAFTDSYNYSIILRKR